MNSDFLRLRISDRFRSFSAEVDDAPDPQRQPRRSGYHGWPERRAQIVLLVVLITLLIVRRYIRGKEST